MSLPAIDLPLHWLRPAWCWALLALPLLAWMWRRARRRQSAWREFVDPHLLPHLLDLHAGRRGRSAVWLGLLGYALAVCALAGPSWRQAAQPLWQTRAPLVIALDLSSATLANDLPPSRLAQARAKIARLLRSRAGGQVALIAYAQDAYTVAPLTDDAANAMLLLDALSPDIMPGDGSDAGRAIAWSTHLLKQAGFAQGDVLLLTDHADAAGRRAAGDAARDGFRVSAIGLGTAEGAVYRDAQGVIGRARLDADALRGLASAGGGRFAALSADERDVEALGLLDPRRTGGSATRGAQARLWQDQGYWLLLPLLVIAAFAFRRGGALAVVLVALAFPWAPAHAADTWWRRPDQQVHAQLEQGVQAYRQGHYDAAARTWQGLPGADAAYNLGNALAKGGDYTGAVTAYDRALRLQPGMQDAIANRAAVLNAMRRKPQPPGGSGQDQSAQRQAQSQQQGQAATAGQRHRQQAQQNAPQREANDARQQQASQQQASQQQASQQQAGPRPGASQPTRPADAEAQRRADAAQRARMQQALARGKASSADKPAGRTETPAQREQRLADDAWLRRIPDDPGALLRARFQLEHERRLQQGGTP
jgi:Ca-activated chloride channel family protein